MPASKSSQLQEPSPSSSGVLGRGAFPPQAWCSRLSAFHVSALTRLPGPQCKQAFPLGLPVPPPALALKSGFCCAAQLPPLAFLSLCQLLALSLATRVSTQASASAHPYSCGLSGWYWILVTEQPEATHIHLQVLLSQHSVILSAREAPGSWCQSGGHLCTLEGAVLARPGAVHMPRCPLCLTQICFWQSSVVYRASQHLQLLPLTLAFLCLPHITGGTAVLLATQMEAR